MVAPDVGAQVVPDGEVHPAELAGEEDVVRVSGVRLDVLEEVALAGVAAPAHEAAEGAGRVAGADVGAQGLAAWRGKKYNWIK